MSEIEKKFAQSPAVNSVKELWQSLQQLTQARIAIGRVGDAQPTDAVLAFEVAQAQARDAVHQRFEIAELKESVELLGLHVMTLQSTAKDRAMYLRRPDAGGRLSEMSRTKLLEYSAGGASGLTIVIADGLSAAAPMTHAVPLLAELRLQEVALSEVVFLATQARVALGDEVGEIVHASAVLMLIGERPGLTSPESLGAYLTWNPRVGRTNAERNCVSNIHPNGLSYSAAAQKLALLITNARRLGATGVDLHDEDDGSSVQQLPTGKDSLHG